MSNLRTGILGLTLTSALALAAFSANAADIYRREAAAGGYKDGPVYATNSWTGFYIGANGGYAFDGTDNNRGSGVKPEGGFGGGQIGYNFQGNFGLGSGVVFGVEADFQGADISDGRNGTLFVPGATADGRLNSKIDYFGTVRGRIGYGFDRTLIYFTGGFAYGNVEDTFRFATDGSRFKRDDTTTGYVLGGGVEQKLSPNWSLKAEYQYINLDRNDPILVPGPTRGTTVGIRNEDTELHTVRVGVNYHFNKEYEPLK